MENRTNESRGKYRLLLVDDEESIRTGMAEGIPWDSWGYEVAAVCSNGQEAIAVIEKEEIHVVLSDIRMPIMDGIELMQYLNSHHPHIKIIILSGYSDFEYLNMSIRNSVAEYLLKPTDLDEFEALFGRIRRTLDQEQQEREAAVLGRLYRSVRLLDAMLKEGGNLESYKEYAAEFEKLTGIRLQNFYLVMCVPNQKDLTLNENEHLFKEEVIKKCSQWGTTYGIEFFLNFEEEIIGITKMEAGWEHEMLIWQMDSLRKLLEEAFRCEFVVSVSELCEDVAVLPNCYRRILYTARCNLKEVNQETLNPSIQQIRQLVDREYMCNWMSLEYVAAQNQRTPVYISKIFKEQTGSNFSDYIANKRMELARTLLCQTQKKVYEIAADTGYADVSNFIRVFKRKTGISPNEYRSMEGGEGYERYHQ